MKTVKKATKKITNVKTEQELYFELGKQSKDKAESFYAIMIPEDEDDDILATGFHTLEGMLSTLNDKKILRYICTVKLGVYNYGKQRAFTPKENSIISNHPFSAVPNNLVN